MEATTSTASLPSHIRSQNDCDTSEQSKSTSHSQQNSSNGPRLCARVHRLLKYIRGPRPKVELSDPEPFLNITLKTRFGALKLPLESAWIKASRPLTHPAILIVFSVVYIVSLAFLTRSQSFLTPSSSWVDCTSAFWSANDGCGLDGQDCLPFFSPTYDLRCPAYCDGVILQNPRTVGDQQAVFEPLIVGGGDAAGTYRGDSFICASAHQAGIIANPRGGCFSLQLISNFTNFISHTSHGLSSLGFPGVFPIAYRFSATTTLTSCTDLRNYAIAFNVLVIAILFLVLRPRPLVLYWCFICIGFWHISLFSQPRSFPPPVDVAFGAFLPTLFVAYALWRVAIRFTLPAFKNGPIEGALWYIGPFWVGLLANITTNIPIDRLVASDLRKRAGAITWLIVIVVVALLVSINQLRVIRKTGWLPWYMGWYILALAVVLVLSQLPGLQLRLHHYIIALFFIPGTGFPTRLSAIFQGFLLGLFLNGVAAFGYDPIVQTAANLLRDAAKGTPLPSFLTNSTTFNQSVPFVNQTITWNALPSDQLGFALLVDDVLRYIGPALNYSLASLNGSIPHFFRLAYVSDGTTGDYTLPAVLWPNGTWVNPLPGPS